MSIIGRAAGAALLALALVPAAVSAAGPLKDADAELRVGSAGPYPGTVVTQCWSGATGSGCDDGPYVRPAQGPTATAAEPMRFGLADGRSFTSYSVRAAPYSDEDGSSGTSLASGQDAHVSSFSFDAPAAGDWVLAVSVAFEGGDASVYYRLHVLPDTATAADTRAAIAVGVFTAASVVWVGSLCALVVLRRRRRAGVPR